MKFFYIIFYCFVFISCSASNEIDESSFNPQDFEKSNKELIRTFKNDYSLWTNKKDIEFYEDLRYNLGIFETELWTRPYT